MPTTVLVYLTGSDATPSADTLKGCSHRLERPCLFDVSGNFVTKATTIGTGMPGIDHGMSMRKTLSFDPICLRPVRSTDCGYPLIWDQATSAGLRCAVVGWPGIIDVSDSPTPMVSEQALLGNPDEQGHWPLMDGSVSPGVSSEAIASVRVDPAHVDPALLPDQSSWALDPKQADEALKVTVSSFARILSTLAALEVVAAEGLDLAIISIGVQAPLQFQNQLGTHVLDIVLDRLPSILGPDLELMIISDARGSGMLTLAGNRSFEIAPNIRVLAQDFTPTMLGMIGLEPSAHMAGRNVLLSEDPASSDPTFVQYFPHTNSNLQRLVEAFEGDELADLPVDQLKELQQYGIQNLQLKVVLGFQKRDFKYALSNAELLVRLSPDQETLWAIAYSSNRVGDFERAGEISRRLLEEFPGTPAALLSSLLSSSSISIEHQLNIINSIEPSALTSATMRSLWGRTAIVTGRIDDGIAVLTRLVDERRHFPADRIMLASIFHKQGKDESALRALGNIGRKPKADLNIRLLRANILFDLGRFQACRALVETTLVHFPLESRARVLLERLDKVG